MEGLNKKEKKRGKKQLMNTDNIVVIIRGLGFGGKWRKRWGEFMVMKGYLTWGGAHLNRMHRCCVVEL